MKRLQDMCVDFGIGDIGSFSWAIADKIPPPYYYSAADMVVMPSHYSLFGMVALKSMACGTPVIASQVGGLAYLVKDEVTGYVIPSDDPIALSNKLLSLIINQKLRNQLGRQAAEYAQAYNWGIDRKKNRRFISTDHKRKCKIT